MRNIIKRSLQTILNTAFLLLVVLPFSTSFDPGMYEDSEGKWVDNYVYSDLELSLFIVPLVMSWVFIQVQRASWNKKGGKKFAIIVSSLYFLYAIQALSIPMQDFSPNYGMLPLLVIFPLLLLYCYIDRPKVKEV